jgi:hypothetical protein
MSLTTALPLPPMTAAQSQQMQQTMGYISPINTTTVPLSTYTALGASTGTTASTIWSNQNGMNVSGAVTASDFVIGDVSLKDTLQMIEKIQERLAILVPDPHKLEKFAALKAAYENYLLLEKLCTEP